MFNLRKIIAAFGVSLLSLIVVACGSSNDNTNSTPAELDPAVVQLPISFEQNAKYTFVNFAGGTADVIDNPYSESSNTSSKVAQMVKDGGETYGGSVLTLSEAISFDNGTVFRMKVYSDREVKVLFKLEGLKDADNAGGADNFSEKEVAHSGKGWEELTFFLSNTDVFTEDPAQKIIFIFDNGVRGNHASSPTDWIFYFDDISQEEGNAPVEAEPTDAPAAPTIAAVDVISIYSEAYTNVASNANPGWSEVSSDETIAGNTVKKTTNFQPFDLNTAVDVSGHTSLHVDVWSETGEVDIIAKLVPSTGDANEEIQTIGNSNVNAGTWTRLEFPLSGFTLSANFQLNDIKQVVIDQDSDATVYYDNIYFSGTGGSPPAELDPAVVQLPISFEQNAKYTFVNFAGGTADVIDNPYSESTNTSSKVAQMVKDGGETYGGSVLTLSEAISFDNGTVFRMKVYSDREVKVLFKLEGLKDADNANGADNFSEKEVAHSGKGWEELTFFLSNTDVFTEDPAQKIIFIFDNGVRGNHASSPTDWIFYFDDISQEEEAEPTDAPVVPTIAAVDVISIYSETYTDVASNANPGWSEVSSDEMIAGNTVKKTTNFQPFDLNTAVDVSGHTSLHVDVWSETGEVDIIVELVPTTGVDNKGVQTIGNINVNAGTWTRLEFPLSAFTSSGTFQLNDIKQVLVNQDSDATVYYDNIYFSK